MSCTTRTKPTPRPVEIVDEIPNIDHRFGDGHAEILGIAVCDDSGRRLSVLAPIPPS